MKSNASAPARPREWGQCLRACAPLDPLTAGGMSPRDGPLSFWPPPHRGCGVPYHPGRGAGAPPVCYDHNNNCGGFNLKRLKPLKPPQKRLSRKKPEKTHRPRPYPGILRRSFFLVRVNVRDNLAREKECGRKRRSSATCVVMH